LFDDVADERDFEALHELEGQTNPRLRQDVLGQISQVPRARRVFGPGTTPIMASFTHLNPEGSRFSDGTYGVYYAAHHRATAIAETVFHQEAFRRQTDAPSAVLEMRCFLAAIDATLHDVRGGWTDVHDRDHYSAGQRLARRLREAGSDGIVYDSVRDPGSDCVAVFYPDRVAPVTQGAHLLYHWNGQRITHVVVANEVIEMG
jgi:hypothetical protein